MPDTAPRGAPYMYSRDNRDIIVVRTNYEKGYEEWFYGKPDKLRMYGHYDFDFLGTDTNNIRLKWMSICFNIDYDNGTMELYLNGAPLPARWPVIGGYLVT